MTPPPGAMPSTRPSSRLDEPDSCEVRPAGDRLRGRHVGDDHRRRAVGRAGITGERREQRAAIEGAAWAWVAETTTASLASVKRSAVSSSALDATPPASHERPRRRPPGRRGRRSGAGARSAQAGPDDIRRRAGRDRRSSSSCAVAARAGADIRAAADEQDVASIDRDRGVVRAVLDEPELAEGPGRRIEDRDHGLRPTVSTTRPSGSW